MLLRGQTEVIIILAILIVAVVAVVFLLQGLPQPPQVPASLQREQQAVTEYTNSLITEAADVSLLAISSHGGYSSRELVGERAVEVDSTPFLETGVPYWVKCENDVSPSRSKIENLLRLGIENHIRNNFQTPDLGKDVEFDLTRLAANARIEPNRIDIEVVLPTTIEGYQLRQPYTVSIPSQLSRIIDFAKDFSKDAARERYFEEFTIASIYRSRLPTIGILTECGQRLVWSTEQLSSGLTDIVKVTKANTVWWQPWASISQGNKVYSIEAVNGKKYTDLDVSIWLPDNFRINAGSSFVVTNSKHNLQSSIRIVPVCIQAYVNTYTLSYPIIIRARDGLTGYHFQFADLVHIQDMKPASCRTLGETQDKCQNLQCSARTEVLEGSGRPLAGAEAVFGGCSIGRADANGIIEGPVKCESGEATIFFGNDFEPFIGETEAAALNRTFILKKLPTIRLTFKEVSNSTGACSISTIDSEHVILGLEDQAGRGFTLDNVDPEKNTIACIEQRGGTAACSPCIQNSTMCEQCSKALASCQKDALLNTITTKDVPSASYSINISASNPNITETYADNINYSFTAFPILIFELPGGIPDDDKNMLVYVPQTEPVYQRSIDLFNMKWPGYLSATCDETCAREKARADALGFLGSYQSEFKGILDRCTGGNVLAAA